MTALAALQIEEAKDEVIKLTDVPPDGATALIPEPLSSDPEDTISIFISDFLVVDNVRLGDLDEGFYRHNIEKEHLLQHSGPARVFRYIIFTYAGNPSESDIIKYTIQHS
ncbi:hypothetical protein LOY52_10915 [Pseudomonas sp. B21-051]|uniref:hypothetical protein n=1 Tax=Pseudomonas sp. B21-051 TaxID=2895491 RepID=UPI00215FD419|nr:hypothetical protein [Pseudomonas sp. B21-051]UVK90552.1 hypothetical protein LOY52_10915 [Pseudomonas sp. B21-051]